MRTKRAVIVGINNYPGTGDDLMGCVNDANDWDAELRSRGFQTVKLLDSAATKQMIVASLRSVVALSRWGDRIVFTYSGHGTWVPDRNGDEADGRDEALVCYDFRQGGLLLDDDMHAIFSQLRSGVRATIISDSCHSGSVSDHGRRSFAGASQPAAGAARFLPPSTFLTGAALDAAERVEQLPARGLSRSGPVLVSGCADDEVSYDVQVGRPHGAFTAAAMATLPAATTVNGWHKAIRTQLPSAQLPQTPQLSASTYQKRLKPLQ